MSEPNASSSEPNADSSSDPDPPARTAHDLHNRQIAISTAGRGRFWDNIRVEQVGRVVQYEEVYLNEYTDGIERFQVLTRDIGFYNHQRRHRAVDYQGPANLYSGALTQMGRASLL